ncbi:hypothetical protein KUCAC02_024250, partial [Chaenocephalus aceratus]
DEDNQKKKNIVTVTMWDVWFTHVGRSSPCHGVFVYGSAKLLFPGAHPGRDFTLQ